MTINTSTDAHVGYRPAGALHVETALEPYSGPFGERQAAHLARRTGFGATPQEVSALQGSGLHDAIQARLHPIEADLAFPSYPDAQLLYAKNRYYTTKMWWYDRLLRTQHPFSEKMALFWHGHFATSIQKVPPALMARQINLFRLQGGGDFRQLLLSVSQDPAMLIWLDNRSNNKAHANENYAREVMELFSLGLGNYTEDDVKNAARAFTGWTLDRNFRFIVRADLHDTGPKTFLGRTGNFDGTDIVGILVSQPVHQRFLARKLLEFFLYSDPEPELTEKLAQIYALSGYNIGQTVGAIVRSNIFFSERSYRALPKSPIEFEIGLLRYFGIDKVPDALPGIVARMGQDLLAPPSVKGWDGGPQWINTSTLLARFNAVNTLMQNRKLNPGFSAAAVVSAAGGMDAERVVTYLTQRALQNDLTSAMRSTLLDYMHARNATLPTPFGRENYEERVRGVLALILNLPANQLN